MLNAISLRTVYLNNPIGIDRIPLTFSWKLEGDGKKQKAYRILTAHTEAELESELYLWDSGKVNSESMTHILYDKNVSSRERVYWKVQIWDESNLSGEWSEAAYFEMGLLEQEEWIASWISGDYEPEKGKRYPADEFRKIIHVPDFLRARLYITACGVYEARFNGQRVGNQILTPGLTGYERRMQYQVFDVSDLLKTGENIWDISLGDGWFRGKLGVFGATDVFGNRTCVKGQLEVVGLDGEVFCFVTDGDFAWCNDGPIRFNDMKDGETIDASYIPSYSGKVRETNWNTVLCCSNNVPVIEHERLIPKVLNTKDGSTVLDFGQNIAGYVEFSIRGKKGHTAKLTMGEMLDKEGNFTLSNLVQKFEFAPEYCDDSRFQTITYICGGEEETWKPKFCIQGFRYVKLENWPRPVEAKHFRAIAVYSDMQQIGEFHCSSKELELLVQNTLWSMKGNFLDVPTDCPTRERAAWTGDAQLFFDTGCYFMDFTAFFQKWIQDMFDDQAEDGKIYNIVPKVAPHEGMSNMVEGSSGWVDAGILIPYRYWKQFADIEVIKKHYLSMKKLADFMVGRMGDTSDAELDQKLQPGDLQKYIVTTGFHFGEWNEPEGDMTDTMLPKYEEATAYLIYSLKCFSEMAAAINEEKDAVKYNEIAELAKRAYQFYFMKDGKISATKMCKYVRPLALGLVEKETQEAIGKGLIQLVRQSNHHVGTGFLSTPFVLNVISEAGYLDDAYQMLEKREYPSWIHEIQEGATTVWENWDGRASRNHYSNGAVCGWIFDTVCGVRVIGKNYFRIAPRPGGTLTEAGFSYQSIYGEVSCSWNRIENKMKYQIHIPAGCSAEVDLPGMQVVYLDAGKYYFEN